MIQAVKTSRGLLVISMLEGWGDWCEVVLLDDDLESIADHQVFELLFDSDLVTAFAALGFPAEEAEALAARFAPPPNPKRERRGRLRRRSSS